MMDNLNDKIAIGYLWNLFSKWMTRFVGIISTLILIRILSPEDFGVAALVSIIIAFFMMLSEVGTDKYLIKAEYCDEDDLDSAWSLNLVLKLFCSLLIATLSSFIADFLNEPNMSTVLLLGSLLPIISALKNVGMVLYERELNYKPLTKLSVFVKLLVFPITISTALILRNYWALIVGILSSEILTVIGSYWMHPYRPKWSRKNWHNQWGFSKWVLLSTISGYVRSRIDALLLGRFLDSTSVGYYRVSQEFAWLPFSELIAPATASFYAGISKVSNNRQELTQKVLQYLSISYMLVMPSCLGIYALQDSFTVVVLGSQWKDAAPILGLLSLLMISMPINISLQTTLTSLSKVSYLFFVDLFMISAIVAGFYVVNTQWHGGVLEFTQFRAYLVSFFVFMLAMIYKLVLRISVLRLLVVCLTPVIPAFIMMMGIVWVNSFVYLPELLKLLLLVVSGITIFLPIMLLLILIMKRYVPEYQFIYQLIIRLFHKIKQ
ncbi:oligosaccharide flippase family protein [Vibrio sp.]|nr:oligosaccharide flippase family protein [Vibrio sp.]